MKALLFVDDTCDAMWRQQKKECVAAWLKGAGCSDVNSFNNIECARQAAEGGEFNVFVIFASVDVNYRQTLLVLS